MAETVKRNPFSRIRKMQALAAEEAKTEKKAEEEQKEETEPIVKKNPFAKKKAAEKAPVVEKEKTETIPVLEGDEDGSPINPDNDDALIAVADVPENEEPVAEKPKKKRTTKKKATKVEAPKEEKEETEEVSSEANEKEETEVTEKKTKRSSKKTADQVSAEKVLSTNTYLKDMFTSDLSVEEAASLVLESYCSPKYMKFKEDVLRRASEVTIDPDMNSGTIRYKLHSIDALKMELLPLKIQTREFLASLMQKDYGALSAYIVENSVGNNAEERKRNSFRALANYDCDGRNVNLLTAMTGVHMRDEFLNSVLEVLENKQRVLVTYLGTLKVDSNVAPISY